MDGAILKPIEVDPETWEKYESGRGPAPRPAERPVDMGNVVDVEKALEMRAQGKNAAQIAKEMGVTPQGVYCAISNWKKRQRAKPENGNGEPRAADTRELVGTYTAPAETIRIDATEKLLDLVWRGLTLHEKAALLEQAGF